MVNPGPLNARCSCGIAATESESTDEARWVGENLTPQVHRLLHLLVPGRGMEACEIGDLDAESMELTSAYILTGRKCSMQTRGKQVMRQHGWIARASGGSLPGGL